MAVQQRWLDGVAGLIVTTDDTFADIVERYLRSWHLDARRATTRSDLLTAVQSHGAGDWVAIVDGDVDVDPEIADALEVVRAVLPSRVVNVGDEGSLRKPIRQSYLFDAIVSASNRNRTGRLVDAALPPHPVTVTEPALDEAISACGVRVLVAQDNLQLRDVLKMQFDELGAAVTFVGDGLEAIEALETGTYSMVFMDCHMPNVEGLTATRAIRAKEAANGGHVRITAMTANAFAEDREACLAAGMDDLAKPIRLANLRAAIERGVAASAGNRT